MTLEEYKERKEVIDADYENDLYELKKEYAEKNNPYKIGDIVQDRHHIIKIEKWGLYVENCSFRPASLLYLGSQLTKSLRPFKKQKWNHMYQNNVENKLN